MCPYANLFTIPLQSTLLHLASNLFRPSLPINPFNTSWNLTFYSASKMSQFFSTLKLFYVCLMKHSWGGILNLSLEKIWSHSLQEILTNWQTYCKCFLNWSLVSKATLQSKHDLFNAQSFFKWECISNIFNSSTFLPYGSFWSGVSKSGSQQWYSFKFSIIFYCRFLTS